MDLPIVKVVCGDGYTIINESDFIDGVHIIYVEPVKSEAELQAEEDKADAEAKAEADAKVAEAKVKSDTKANSFAAGKAAPPPA